MTTAETVASTAVGVLLIGTVARDVVDTVFDPEGRGTLARLVMRSVWGAFRALATVHRRALFSLAGPAVLLAVLATWSLWLITGWALVLWPHLPDGFHFPGATRSGSFVSALNVSMVTLTTLGFGDIVPAAPWLRVVAPLEALVGFGLLSASISWLLMIYPALSRRRSLAYELSLLAKAEHDTEPLEDLEPAAVESVLAELTSRLVAVERDLVGLPVSYYFPENDERFALAASLPYLVDLADRFDGEDAPARLRLRAVMLQQALVDFAATTSGRFHGGTGSTVEQLEHYARDNLVDVSLARVRRARSAAADR